MRVAGPTTRLGILTGAAAVALAVAALFGHGGPRSAQLPVPVTPAGFEVTPEGAACPGGERQVVLRGLGRPIKVELKGARHRSLVRRRPPTGSLLRDRWQLVARDLCLADPCGISEGLKSLDPRACADR